MSEKVISINTPTVNKLKAEIMGKAINDDAKTTLFELLDLVLRLDNLEEDKAANE